MELGLRVPEGLTLPMNPVRIAERDILRYLLAHPDARDTLDGIEKWWLPASKEYRAVDIAGALLHLEKRNLVRAWKPASGRPVYGRCCADPSLLEHYLRTLE